MLCAGRAWGPNLANAVLQPTVSTPVATKLTMMKGRGGTAPLLMPRRTSPSCNAYSPPSIRALCGHLFISGLATGRCHRARTDSSILRQELRNLRGDVSGAGQPGSRALLTIGPCLRTLAPLGALAVMRSKQGAQFGCHATPAPDSAISTENVSQCEHMALNDAIWLSTLCTYLTASVIYKHMRLRCPSSKHFP